MVGMSRRVVSDEVPRWRAILDEPERSVLDPPNWWPARWRDGERLPFEPCLGPSESHTMVTVTHSAPEMLAARAEHVS